MLDIGGLELLVIAVVLIVVVGPKDLPKMLRTFGRMSSQMRRMAGDFRRQFDDALREAEIDELRGTADEMRKLDPREDIRKAMSPMRAMGDEIRSSLQTATASPPPRVPSSTEGAKPAPTDVVAANDAVPPLQTAQPGNLNPETRPERTEATAAASAKDS